MPVPPGSEGSKPVGTYPPHDRVITGTRRSPGTRAGYTSSRQLSLETRNSLEWTLNQQNFEREPPMPMSMYRASVPVFLQMLPCLSAVLDKTAAHAAAKKIDP